MEVLNIVTCGHIAHGKTTILYELTGKWTLRYSEELKRGITIRLGYVDLCIRKCPNCKEPECYTTSEKCSICGKETQVIKKISFVDAPGHETLMATMLTGAAITDGAILVIAANETCPQPQTKEHLTALELLGVKKTVIAQNKIDLVDEKTALENYNQIKKFVKGTIAENAPIIPVAAQHRANVDLLLQKMDEIFKEPERDLKSDPVFLIARSFDVNKPGTDFNKLIGGVVGGVLKKGVLRKGQEIEILPGIKIKEEWTPIKTKILSLSTGNKFAEEVTPGGSIGISTEMDPGLVRADSLSGCILGLPGKLPEVLHNIEIEIHLMEKIVGTKEEHKVEPLNMNEFLVINAWTAKTVGQITSISGNKIKLSLKLPVCISKGEKIAISRRINNRWRLVGYGVVL